MSEITFRTLRRGDVEAYIAPDFLAMIAAKAEERRNNARAKGRKQMHFVEGTKWDSVDTEVQSMSAEYAVAHYFGLHDYEPIIARPDRKDGDLTINDKPIEVKSTDRERGCLVVRKDALSRPYVLAISNPPLVRIPGWIMSDDAKQDQFWRKDVRDPAYFIPQDELLTLAYLEEALR
jgi:hypothetical protein